MAITAIVTCFKNQFVAALSDGRSIEHSDFREMGHALFCAGVMANDVQYEWREGQRMITAGQQVALRAEISRLGRKYKHLAVAA